MFSRTLFFAAIFCLAAFRAVVGDEARPILLSSGGETWPTLTELQKAAAAGKPSALNALGEMFLNGEQVTVDIPKGLQFLEKAAKAGSAPAAIRLGKTYEDGILVPADAPKAIAYYRQAALGGVAEAQYNLGAIYVSGRGVPRDYKEGLAWLIVATKHGADADGEKRVRDRLDATRRGNLIPAAEQRAEELEIELLKALPAAAPSPTPANHTTHATLPSAISGKK
jgi:TPR repeat protein